MVTKGLCDGLFARSVQEKIAVRWSDSRSDVHGSVLKDVAHAAESDFHGDKFGFRVGEASCVWLQDLHQHGGGHPASSQQQQGVAFPRHGQSASCLTRTVTQSEEAGHERVDRLVWASYEAK